VTEAESAATPRREYLSFSGSAQEYFRIWIVNVLLTALTLGVYSAWAKVRRRRYVYGHTTLSQGRFDYHARPVAILRGRGIAVILLLIVLATQIYFPRYVPVFGTLIAVTIPWLIVRSRMFTMYNTSYSNIRFGFTPAYWESFRTVFFAGLLTVGTFGIGTPVAHYLRNRFVVRHTRYGNLPFKIEAVIWDFFTAYLMTFVASTIIIFPLLQSGFGLLGGLRIPTSEYGPFMQWALPVLSGLAAYYVVAQFLSAATLRPTLNGSYLCGLGADEKQYRLGCEWSLNRLLFMYVVNFVAIVCSLGLLIPWAQMRVSRYLVNGTWVELDDTLEQAVAQQAQQISAVGEEIGSAFDVDIGL